MRALFTAMPAFGHLLPLLPLARAAREAGTEVLVATHGSLRSGVGNLPFAATGPSTVEALEQTARRYGSDGTDFGDPVAVVGLFTDSAVDLGYQGLLELARDFAADVVVADELDFVAPLVATALGVPWVTHGITRAMPVPLVEALDAGLAQRFADRGLTPITPVARITIWPSWMQPEGWTPPAGALAVQPTAHTDETAPAVDLHFPGREDRPTVLFTLGTIVQDAQLVASCLRELAALDVNTIATVPAGVDLAVLDVPADRVRTVGFVPLDQLLPPASVLVAAGGAGTVLAGLGRGLPMALLPVLADQSLLSAAVAETGAAIVCGDPGELAPAVQRLLTDPRFADAAQAVAGRLADLDTPLQVWEHLLHRLQGDGARA